MSWDDVFRLHVSTNPYFPSAYDSEPEVSDVARVKSPPGYINLYRALQAVIKHEAATQDISFNPLMRLWPFTVKALTNKGLTTGVELRQLARFGVSKTKVVRFRLKDGSRFIKDTMAHDAEWIFRASIKRLERFVRADKQLLLLKGSKGPECGVTHIRASFLRPYFSNIARTGVVFRDDLNLPKAKLEKLPPYLIVHIDEKKLKRRLAGEGERAAITAARNADLRAVVEFIESIEWQLPDDSIRFEEAKELCDAALASSPNWPTKESRSNGWFRTRVWRELTGNSTNGRRKLLSLAIEIRRSKVLKDAAKTAQTLLADG